MLVVIDANSIDLESKQMNVMDPMIEPRTDFFKAITEFGDDSFIKVASFEELPGKVFFHSSQWASAIFAKGSGPDDKPVKAAISYRPVFTGKVDFDILKRHYDIRGMHVQIFEITTMLNVQVLNFDKEVHEEPDIAKRITLLSTILFKIPSPQIFYKISVDSEGTLYSSNPSKTYVQIHNWWDRMDCIVKDAEIGYFIYKEKVGVPNKTDPNDWFTSEMRNKKTK
jgi:hypothetical protein